MFKAVLSLAGMSLLAGSAYAADGVLIVETTIRNGTAVTNQIQIEKTRMRAESADPNGGKRVFMFDSTAQVMRMVDVDKKTYSEITKAEVDQMGGQMSAMMAQMQEQMKNLPPERRAQMEAMMAGRGMPATGEPPKTEYRKTGTDKVGKWTCQKYEGYREEKKVSEVCTVDPKVLGFTMADFDVTKQLAAFFQKLMPQNAGQMFQIGNAEQQGFSGVPVRRTFSMGQAQIVTEISDVSHQSFPDATFAVPAGFQKTPSPFGGRGGRGRQ
jgi:hypothetical protein